MGLIGPFLVSISFMQTKLHSFYESVINVSVGYIVAVSSQIVIFPLFDIHIPMVDNFIMGLWFTVISIVRSYVLRRLFNKKTVKDMAARGVTNEFESVQLPRVKNVPYSTNWPRTDNFQVVAVRGAYWDDKDKVWRRVGIGPLHLVAKVNGVITEYRATDVAQDHVVTWRIIPEGETL